MYRASYCNVLVTNEMQSSYNQFLFHSFLSALHVSNESSRSSSGARHNILYYTHSTIVLTARLYCVCNTIYVYYAALLMMDD